MNERIQSEKEPAEVDGCFFIQLTQGMRAIVDKEDYVELSRHKWCILRAYGKNVYAVRNTYERGRRNPIMVRMHNVIIGSKKGEIVDHINRDTLDNRRSNLRIVSRSENLKNSDYYEQRMAMHK